MAIENCKRCGTLYHKTIKDICGKCVQIEEEAYKKVRMHLKRHKTIEMAEVSKQTGVELELIHQFLQEGRITLDSSSGASYPCKQCGAPIQEGAICLACTKQLTDIQRDLLDLSNEDDSEEVEEKKSAFHSR